MTTIFQEKVYVLCKKIPKGKISTYKELGRKLGKKGQTYRTVGAALKKSPGMPEVPCHRIICSDGSLGGFNRGLKEKISLLKKEGIEIKENQIKKIFFKLKT